MRAGRVLVGLLLALHLALAACSGGGGSGDDASSASGNWNELRWDEHDWQ